MKSWFFSLECLLEMQNRVEVIEDEDVARSAPASGAKAAHAAKSKIRTEALRKMQAGLVLLYRLPGNSWFCRCSCLQTHFLTFGFFFFLVAEKTLSRTQEAVLKEVSFR